MTPAWLLLPAALAACTPARPTDRRCAPREIVLLNRSSLPLEQIFLGTPTDPGPNLLTAAPLQPARTLTFRAPGGTFAFRAVWVDGRAAEAALDGCALSRITLTDGSVQPE